MAQHSIQVLACVPAAQLPTQLPANCLKAVEHSPSPWALESLWEIQKKLWLPASNQPISGHSNHLSSQSANGRSLCLFLCNSAFQLNLDLNEKRKWIFQGYGNIPALNLVCVTQQSVFLTTTIQFILEMIKKQSFHLQSPWEFNTQIYKCI